MTGVVVPEDNGPMRALLVPIALLSLAWPAATLARPSEDEQDRLLRAEEAKMFFLLRENMQTTDDILTTALLGFRASGGDDPDGKDVFRSLEALDKQGKLTLEDLRSLKAMVFVIPRKGPMTPEQGNEIADSAGIVLARFDGTPTLDITAETKPAHPRTYTGRKVTLSGRLRVHKYLSYFRTASGKKDVVIADDVPNDIVVLNARGVPWDQALDLFTEWRGLRWKEADGKIFVSRDPHKKSALEKPRTD